MVEISVWVPDNLLEALDRAAAELEITRADLIRQVLLRYVEDVEDLNLAVKRLQDPADSTIGLARGQERVTRYRLTMSCPPCKISPESSPGGTMAQGSIADPLSITLGVEEEFFLVDPETRDLLPDPDPRIFEYCNKNRGDHKVVAEFLRSQIETTTRVCSSVAGRPFGPHRDPPPRHRRGRAARRRGAGRLHPSLRGLAQPGRHGGASLRTVRHDLPAGRTGTARGRDAHPRGFRRRRQPRPGDDGHAPLPAPASRALGILALQQRAGDRLQVLPSDPLRQHAAHGIARAAALLGGIREPGRRLPADGVHQGQQRALVGHPAFPGIPHPGTADLRHLPDRERRHVRPWRSIPVSCGICFAWIWKAAFRRNRRRN